LNVEAHGPEHGHMQGPNSLIVGGEKERHLDVVEAVLLRLDERDLRRIPQATEDHGKSDPTPVVTKYGKDRELNDIGP